MSEHDEYTPTMVDVIESYVNDRMEWGKNPDDSLAEVRRAIAVHDAELREQIARQALSALYDGTVEDGIARMFLRTDIAAALGIEP